MIGFDKDGWATSLPIKVARYPALKVGMMVVIHGIIVHQTASASSASTLSQYKLPKANGAHFLIDKDGTIIQTASILWKVKHVGPLKSRCLVEQTCTAVEAQKLAHMKVHAMAMHELAKAVPERYPANKDAIGIEVVGATVGESLNPPFEPLTARQQKSLKWLVAELRQNFGIPLTEVFRHPDVSRKDPHEAESARW